jgi:ppGpp synthetase/RelA/SpoT-type nucleotidyltranferase
MNNNLTAEYDVRFSDVLVPASASLETLLKSYFQGIDRIDRVCARAKSPKRFLQKSEKVRDGVRVYQDPLGEIQDQIGARIIVFYTDDVEPASQRVLKYFRHIEELRKEPASESEFGYFGRHYILALPPDCIPEGIERDDAPAVFELQVRTLFQHAWSEAEHDLAYKPIRPLTADEKRKFAFTAAQAWGADTIFQALFNDLNGKPHSQSG